MYETLDATMVLAILEEAFAWARARGFEAVTLTKGRRLRGWLSRSGHAQARGTETVRLSEVESVVTTAMESRTFVLGEGTWRQRRGVPIGGLTSRFASTALPGVLERSWESGRGRRAMSAWARPPSPDVPASAIMGIRRYVDDVIAASRCLCAGCLTTTLDAVYAPALRFDENQPPGTAVDWLDMSVSVAATATEPLYVLPRQAFLEEWAPGPEDLPTRWRAPPFLAGSHPTVAQMAGRRAGTVARWREMQLSGVGLRAAVAAELLAWARSGWPLRLLRPVWAAACVLPAVPAFARRLLQQWQRSGIEARMPPLPWEHPTQG
jgi:hypothetical protein